MKDRIGTMTAVYQSSINSPIAGIELGGTKCICTLAFGPGRIVDQQLVDTTNPAQTLSALRQILESWWLSHGFCAIGIGSFGPICLDPVARGFGHILQTTKPGWSNADVFGQLTHGFNVPTGLDTDVNAAAHAELAWGCGQGLRDFAYVTVGTGIGVGLIVNGATPRGILHGELGHMIVPRRLDDCFESACTFHHNCAEGLASGTAIKQRLGAEHISAIAADHPVWDYVVETLAGLCHNMVCSTGPQRIAFGGGVMNRQPHLISKIESRLLESLAGYINLPSQVPYIVAPDLGAQAGPLGTIILGLRAKAELDPVSIHVTVK